MGYNPTDDEIMRAAMGDLDDTPSPTPQPQPTPQQPPVQPGFTPQPINEGVTPDNGKKNKKIVPVLVAVVGVIFIIVVGAVIASSRSSAPSTYVPPVETQPAQTEAAETTAEAKVEAIEVAKPVTVKIYVGKPKTMHFAPHKTGRYRIYSEGDVDTFATVYDSQGNIVADSDDDGDDNNFSLTVDAVEDEEYDVEVNTNEDGETTINTEEEDLDEIPDVENPEDIKEPEEETAQEDEEEADDGSDASDLINKLYSTNWEYEAARGSLIFMFDPTDEGSVAIVTTGKYGENTYYSTYSVENGNVSVVIDELNQKFIIKDDPDDDWRVNCTLVFLDSGTKEESFLDGSGPD